MTSSCADVLFEAPESRRHVKVKLIFRYNLYSFLWLFAFTFSSYNLILLQLITSSNFAQFQSIYRQ